MEEYDDLQLDEEILFDLNPILSEIYSSSSSSQPLISNNTSSSSSGRSEPQTSDDDGVIMKQLIMSPIVWESSSASASVSASAQHIFSFGNNSYFPGINSDILNSSSSSTTPELVTNTHLSSQIIDFSSSSAATANKHDFSSTTTTTTTTTRTPSQAHEHLMSERKHREHLRQLFISLSKILPGLKKLDKASLLEDAANYLKALEERVAILEEQQAKRSSVTEASKLVHDCSSSYNTERRTIDDDDDDDDDEKNNIMEVVPEIKARISERKVLIKISCKKEKGLMSIISCEMEKMHLTVLDMRMMPFGGSAAALDITLLAETQSEFRGTVKDIVDHLQSVVLKNPPRSNSNIIDMQLDDHTTK